MRHILAACLFGGAVFVATVSAGGAPIMAQDDDDLEATIAALQTRVAELEGTVEARGEKINAQRTTIAELRPSPTATIPPEPTPPPAPAYASGGLGLSRAEWEAEHGQGEGSSIIAYEDQTYLVTFGENGNIDSISWNFPEPMALEDAEAIMVTLMPADAVLVQRTLTEFGEPADYYTSASLATRFDADYPFWQDTGPGAFFVHYYIDGGSGLVASAMIGLGD